MKKINTKKLSIGIFKLVMPLFVILFVQASINAQAPIGFMSCAKEGERCKFEGTKEVMYGAGNGWVKMTATNGIDCGVAAFGSDPAENVWKECYIPFTVSPGTKYSPFEICAKREGERCQFTGTREVMYGAGDKWSIRQATDGILCSADIFGDPAPNVYKACFVSSKTVSTTPRKFPETYQSPIQLKPGTNSTSLSNLKINGFGISESSIVSGAVIGEAQNKGLEYTVLNVPTKYLNPGIAMANMQFEPKAMLKDGVLYIHLTTVGSSVALDRGSADGTRADPYVNQAKEKGFYIQEVETAISTQPDFTTFRHGPENVNKETGVLTDMKSYGLEISKTGPGASFQMGSSFSQTIMNYSVTDWSATMGTNIVKGTWVQTEAPDFWKTDAIGQFNGIKELPALATTNFPVYEQAIFKATKPGYLPDSVTFDVTLRVLLKKAMIVPRNDAPILQGAKGLIWLFLPQTYQGELDRIRATTTAETSVKYTLTLDLTPLKK